MISFPVNLVKFTTEVILVWSLFSVAMFLMINSMLNIYKEDAFGKLYFLEGVLVIFIF